uniref:Uncharacterized protein n=1 Tax=Phytophthora fragariae TaxID=53985 RepID=A0A6A3D9Z5_9STRA|nr:hypothetical protein PF009_g32563 [Phytophthora fragariae]
MVRGRQAGYHNYSDKEELLLCDVAAKFVPIAPVQGDDYNLGLQNEGDVSDASPSPAENSATTNTGFVDDPSDPSSLQAAPNSSRGRADSTGTVATSQGFVPVEIAADYDVESSDEDAEEQDSQSIESSE